ncbi:sialate O-acetylesterase [Pedobacter xixiisoli]|uniref:Sialate O-acetylesterase domain-containing protein n=1 Tax=Pedobacter xixiisoli TaxID=1476464 RepID=A0A285ZSC7_9SPHI|nr:sialate O-acetylesterase [Pedobacter xixiisoli]SOD12535.1 protein of unknown function [Pedobacter xixiisoli]
MCKPSHLRKLCPKFLGKILLFFIIYCLTPQSASAVVKLPKLATDSMILQRNINIPIWGTAAVGEVVTVTFKGATYTVTTPSTGKWAVSLAPSAAGGPYTMTVAGTNTINLKGILVGDVYICSGQSNMQYTFSYGATSTYYADEIANSANTNIRQFKVNFGSSATPLDDIIATPWKWQSARPSTMNNFSTTGYFFAKSLYQKYGVPIGIITSTYSGSIIEAWISHEGLINFPNLYNQAAGSAPSDPSAIYNALLSPLRNYGVKGFVWYQGESNTSNSIEYRDLLPAFINDVRTKFNKPNLPFLYVQLAGWNTASELTQTSAIAQVREAQAMANSINLTGMAVAHEISLSGVDIHPIWKKPVGDRLSLAAQNIIYGETNVAYEGPSYQSHTVVGNKIVITFKNVGTGLYKTGTDLKQFTIAGADQVYKIATATIVGTNKVEITAATVANPLYARYAWVDNPRSANLYGSTGLPAESFRTGQTPVTPPSLYGATPFAAGNLVVTRYGNGSALPAIGTTIPVYLEEFNTLGVSQTASRLMPSVAGNYNAGITNLTVGTHSFGVEALLSLSENKKYLAFASNNLEVGVPVNASGSKTIAILTADGALNTTTSANLGVARTATVNDDLSRIYYNSQTQGISYVPYGTSGANVVLAAGENAYRGLGIYNGQLYASTTVVAANGSIPAVSKQVATVGTGMPTSGIQTLTALPGITTTEIVRQFVLLSTANNTNYDLFYGVTESGKLIKYKLISGNWVDRGSLNIANVVSITGKWNTNGTTHLYCTTLNTSTYASNLVKVEDFPATSATLATNAVTVIATAAANTYFKGVAFAPENSDATMLPMNVTSFNGANDTQGVKLKWETTSDQNGDSFEVMRSTDGVEFKSIGNVKAVGNATDKHHYTFTDFNPAEGVNYYQLNQKYLDGTSGKSKLATVNSQLSENVFKIFQVDANQFRVTISAQTAGRTSLIITDAVGKKRLVQQVSLQSGISQVMVPNQSFSTGVYILHAVIDGKKQSVKFLVN